MKLALPLLLVMATTLAADEPATLQGQWFAVSAEKDGEKAEFIRGHRLTFGDVRFTITDKDGKLLYSGTYRTDPEQKPSTIDFLHADPNLAGMPWKGIYKLADGKLTICDNAGDPKKARPRDFTARAGSGYVLVVFQRAKP